MMSSRLLGAVVLLFPVVLVLSQDIIENVSFRPPFASYDAEGQRTIDNWSFGGNVAVNENFVRLTPDRASKRGWLWARSPLENDQWTATVRFRVSGQGKRLFGDGVALWFTQQQYHVDGQLHGFTDTFTGFGILFDTFRNTEAGHVHKDVSLMVGQGTALDATTTAETPGCDGDFRYWEGRADFSVANKSTVKITYMNGRVSVALDAHSTGEFSTCIQDHILPFPANWHKTAHLGVTATTGQLADNHDILSVLVSPQADTVIPEQPVEAAPADLTTGNPQIDAVVQAAVAREVKKVADKLQHLHHHLEHQLSSVHDSIKHTLNKIQEQEKADVRRIDELEHRLGVQVEDHVEDAVLNTVEETLEGKMEAVEEALQHNVATHVQSSIDSELGDKLGDRVNDHLSAAGRGWLIPFVILSLAMVGLAAFGYSKYKHLLLKTHLP